VIVIEEYNPNHRYELPNSRTRSDIMFDALKEQLRHALERRDMYESLKGQLRRALERKDRERVHFDFRGLSETLKRLQ